MWEKNMSSRSETIAGRHVFYSLADPASAFGGSLRPPTWERSKVDTAGSERCRFAMTKGLSNARDAV